VGAFIVCGLLSPFDACVASAQTNLALPPHRGGPRWGPRLAVLRAEDRRAPTPEDLATIRAGLHGGDVQTVRIAVRALGRLERPALIADILPLLQHRVAEVRAEAANAIGQAAQGWRRDRSSAAAGSSADVGSIGALETPLDGLEGAQAALIARLRIDADSGVRAVIDDTLGRLPYVRAEQVEAAERALLDSGSRRSNDVARERSLSERFVRERVGLAQGLYRLTRFHRTLHPFSAAARAVLLELSAFRAGRAGHAGHAEELSAARVRRLALEAYLALGPPGPVDRSLLGTSLRDPDVQVRRLAARGVAAMVPHEGDALLKLAVEDESPSVRIEALRGVVTGDASTPAEDGCAMLVRAVANRAMPVALTALDELSRCVGSAGAIDVLTRATATLAAAADRVGAPAPDSTATAAASADLTKAGQPRGWHRAAHGLLSLAVVAPDRAAASLGQFTASPIWQLRMHAARAAMTLKNRGVLETLAADPDDNVREAAVEALAKLYAHDGDAIFVAELTRTGNQVLRAAALALVGTPHGDLAIAPLQSALRRLVAGGSDNSHDARDAINKALESLGKPLATCSVARLTKSESAFDALDAETLRWLTLGRTHTSTRQTGSGAPVARVTIRGVGAFELALLPAEAPATVLRFVRLAESGYYNGLTFHRVVPNFVIQGGSPGANEYIGDALFMRDEVGLLPHVRGAVGISTRGRDTGDAQIFVDLVDNPRLDHEYTVFAEVRSGMDVVDGVLEGDVIERVDILR
jgi:cyclophilin family peptidyl-prolyl cis-trans isomerase/HEAT repeat protein